MGNPIPSTDLENISRRRRPDTSGTSASAPRRAVVARRRRRLLREREHQRDVAGDAATGVDRGHVGRSSAPTCAPRDQPPRAAAPGPATPRPGRPASSAGRADASRARTAASPPRGRSGHDDGQLGQPPRLAARRQRAELVESGDHLGGLLVDVARRLALSSAVTVERASTVPTRSIGLAPSVNSTPGGTSRSARSSSGDCALPGSTYASVSVSVPVTVAPARLRSPPYGARVLVRAGCGDHDDGAVLESFGGQRSASACGQRPVVAGRASLTAEAVEQRASRSRNAAACSCRVVGALGSAGRRRRRTPSARVTTAAASASA